MTANNSTILCPSCYTPVPPSQFNSDKFAPCPTCQAKLLVAVFPAAFRPIAPGQSGERILIAGESSCFYHDQKKAVVPCDTCGRFLCALCDVDLGGKHVCPQCLDTGRQKGALQQLETRRVVYDSAALIVALTAMLLFCIPAFVTAPVAIALGVMSHFKPNSILGFSRWKAYGAIVLALFQIVLWVLTLMGIFNPFMT
jgi:uncharacterized paraquat-inducible protein A